MFIYFLHILCTIAYLSQFPSNIFIASLFYAFNSIPPIHRKTIYYLTEFKIPPWFLLFKCFLHMSLFASYTQKILILSVWMIIYVCNDLYFVVHHAEKRLMKIDELLYENKKRIAHLYLNTYQDDVENRFHRHLFETNRLYLLDTTPSSERTSLAIHNYRQIIKGGLPKNPIDSIMRAARGKTIFLSNKFLMYLPGLFVFILSGFISFEKNYLTLINEIILLSELCVFLLEIKYFYILSNVVFLVCLLFADSQKTVYLIAPINS